MTELSAEVSLRPTRIGFLTRPTDLTSVRAIMRACACLWGGVYNPIIPVFKRPPKEWKPEPVDRFRGIEVAKGYTRFFEPDVYVEAEDGLLEKAGLRALRVQHAIHPQVITLKQLFEPAAGRNWSEPEFGLNIHDVLKHIYKTEQQFVHREKRGSLLIAAERGNALTEGMFGVYPSSEDVGYIQRAYLEVYKPERVSPTPETWRRVFLKGAETPLRVTRHGLDTQRYWYHDPVLFVFDPSRAIDLIDLWNMRLEPHPVLPIPLGWWEALGDVIHAFLKSEHRPVVGNPYGVMHNATIEFARSIPKADAERLIRTLKPGLPQGALVLKYWRTPIWIEHRDAYIHRDNRIKVIAEEERVELPLKDGGDLRTSFGSVAPDFAGRYGKGDHRWVNVLRVSNYSDRSVATLLPLNTFNRQWPPLGMAGEQIAVSSEGWVYPQRFKTLDQSVQLLSTDDAVIGSLGQFGIEAELSEPGHIARQMLEQLGSLRGTYLLADVDTLKLLNKMAGGLRRKRNDDETVEESFELRTAALKDWTDLIAQRAAKHDVPGLSLGDYTKRNIIRLGLETDCPHCRAKSWSTLTNVDYKVTCERCLKPYDFPQASLRDFNRNFTYRVVGPFSAPDFGRGSYSALLALHVLDRYNSAGRMTFSTAMTLRFDGIQREVDFVAWRAEERMEPQLIIGEVKSLGAGELIKAGDLAKMKSVALKLPDAVVVIAVLRDHFTAKEKELLRAFVNWSRRPNVFGQPTNPVLLLTVNELLMRFGISTTWKQLGGQYAKFADYDHTRNLFNFADATQQIYLGMPSFHAARGEYWLKRHKRRMAARAKKGAA